MGRDSGFKSLAFAVGGGALLCAAGYLCYKASEKADDEQLSEACIYMAVLDDQIAINELGEDYFNGEEVEFASRRESLKSRYDIFMDAFKDSSKLRIEREIKRMQRRLEKSLELANGDEVCEV